VKRTGESHGKYNMDRSQDTDEVIKNIYFYSLRFIPDSFIRKVKWTPASARTRANHGIASVKLQE